MTTHDREPEDDEAYLWSGEGPADPQIAELERALGPLKSKHAFDAADLPSERLPAKPIVAEQTNVVRPKFWGRAAWVVPAAAAAVVAAWFASRPPSEETVRRVAETSSPTADLPPNVPTSLPAKSVPITPQPSCESDRDGVGLAFETLEGEPARCGEGVAPKEGKLPTGVWMTTPKGTRIRVRVAALGQVDIEPESRVRVLATSEKEHRLELARGTLHAVIDAPPRLFFVQTRSAIAIDLGCEYTLTVDELGNGLLSVKTGFVELAVPTRSGQASSLSSLVPKGASAALIDGRGPGLPVWDREPQAVKEAARRVDANPSDEVAVDALIDALGARNTLTLVHLLPRVPRASREKILKKLAPIEPIPAEVQAKAIEGDEEAPRDVRQQFEPHWFPQPQTQQQTPR